ncbi:MAG TPA: GDP-mannose 4,6-dehydratase [Anaerolineales bacterium]|nr:GDP-mannose 4,6-dehydratase [Anaerolineales bacterium]
MSTRPLALITGISGFVGRHLQCFLTSQDWQIRGFDRQAVHGEYNVYIGDITNLKACKQVLMDQKPDVIFHLAGLIKANEPERLFQTNLLGTVALFEGILATDQRPRVVITSSSAVYGPGLGLRPITERFALRPQTHYGLSKAAQEMSALRYYHAYGVPVICIRTFNLLGPGLSPQLACSSFAQQIALSEKIGHPAVISTGDLHAKRDFVDVRDAVRAYTMLAEQGKPGDTYNVCSGEAVSIRDCLDILLKQARVPVEAVLDPAKVQKNDVPIQIGSAKKLRDVTGWNPQITLKQSLIDLLNDWRQRVEME